MLLPEVDNTMYIFTVKSETAVLVGGEGAEWCVGQCALEVNEEIHLGLHIKCQFYLYDFNQNYNCLTVSHKISQS